MVVSSHPKSISDDFTLNDPLHRPKGAWTREKSIEISPRKTTQTHRRRPGEEKLETVSRVYEHWDLKMPNSARSEEFLKSHISIISLWTWNASVLVIPNGEGGNNGFCIEWQSRDIIYFYDIMESHRIQIWMGHTNKRRQLANVQWRALTLS